MASRQPSQGFEPTVILDSLGGPYTDAAIGAIANRGRLVVYGTSNDQQVTINLRRMYRKAIDMLGYSGLVETADEQRDIAQHAAVDDGRRHSYAFRSARCCRWRTPPTRMPASSSAASKARSCSTARSSSPSEPGADQRLEVLERLADVRRVERRLVVERAELLGEVEVR